MADAPIKPRFTFRDVYGDLVFCPRASPRSCRWLSNDPLLLNSRTGNGLAIVGDMDVLCSRGVARRESLELLRSAGIEPATKLNLFGNEDEYYEQLAKLAGGRKRLLLLHQHEEGAVAPEKLWIPRSLVAYLNNKGNLGELVPPEHAPARRVYGRRDLAAAIAGLPLPIVLKAATDESTGGGDDVRLCTTRDDLAAAHKVFGDCERVVAEELLDIRRSVCLNYAVMTDGTIEYLGGAEQICSKEGLYLGNWVEPGSPVSESVAAVGKSIVAKGAERGYRGIAGVDVAILDDGRAIAFDLNFRTNGSTGMLLLRDSIVRSTGKDVLRLRGWKGLGNYEDVLDAGYIALDSGYFLPLAAYDPRADGFDSGVPRLNGLMLGSSREEILEREREMAALGLE